MLYGFVYSECGGLHSADLETSSKFVEDKLSECLTLDILTDYEEGSVLLHGMLEQVEDALDVGNLLLGDEQVGVIELGPLSLRVGDEVGRDEASVELHTLDEIDLVLQSLAIAIRY